MILKLLDRLEETVIATLMGAATIVIFVAVVHRYASGVSWLYDYARMFNLSWAQELCIYMFVWMAKFGAAYGVRTGIHVGVDAVINRLSTPWRNRSIVFGLLSGAVFTGIVGTLGLHFVLEMSRTEQVSADMEVPMWLVYLAIPCGSYLMCFRFLQVCWSFIRTGELPSHDHSHVEGIDVEEVVHEEEDHVDEIAHPEAHDFHLDHDGPHDFRPGSHDFRPGKER
ncbi:MAG TPA: TRAP transporter small permease [Azospirillaceae bacterium]|nr:TRAP transporter small permease [Azospirillaceae bacterium]